MSISACHRRLLYALFICITIFGLIFAGCKRKAGNTGGDTNVDPGKQALLYLSENQLDAAEASFLKAIQLIPDTVSNYVGLARLYILQKNWQAAETQVNNGLKVKPDYPDLKLILADIYIKKGNNQSAVNQLKEILSKSPKNVKAYYKLAGLGPAGSDQTWEKPYLLKVLDLAPANIVPRLRLSELFAVNNQTDSSLFYLEGVKKIAPDFSTAAQALYQQAVASLHGNQPLKALPFIRQFHQLMKITPLYDAGLDEVELNEMIAGYPGFIISQDEATTGAKEGGVINNMSFTDATERVGLPFDKALHAAHSALAVADREANGNLYIYAGFQRQGSSSFTYHLWISKLGGFQDCHVIGGLDHDGQDLTATFADYDNDGYQDLFIVTTKGTLVYRNQGDGSFSKITDNIGLSAAIGQKVLFADFDQDGDLDMYIAQKGGNKFFRNNGDGTFTEKAAAMGLAASPNGSIDMDFGDWDSDGDLDIVALDGNGNIQLFNNNRHSSFKDISDSVGLKKPGLTGTAVAFGDYNNDGLLDIFVAGGPGGKCFLFKNTGHSFVIDPVSEVISNSLKGITVNDVKFLDFDNDGHQDILVAGVNNDNTKSGVRLFHNDTTKGFRDVSNLLAKSVMQSQHARVGDFDQDGDQDIFLSGPSGTQLIRNDGGNENHNIQVQLFGLSYGNSKNNRLGIGAQVELKAGDLYQLKTVTSPVTEFGVGSRTKLDAVRIIWPNGVPQTIVDPSKKDRILETEKLKGSCPFLFTWNGKNYEFIKDMLWRSAMGMPLAINGKDTTYSFSDASKEYLLIPGEKLKPKDGKYSIKITEELWEAVYVDKAGLVAVDHPDSVDTYVDERFVPPPFPGKTVYQVTKKYLPVSAKDEKGNNLLPKISSYDFQYAANFSLGKFQGVATDHDLVLDLGKNAKSDSLRLFLRGWIFPSDASINTAITQSDKYRVHPPCLQVINSKGEWQTVISNIGFPMGRDKMVIANLSGKFLTPNDRRVRISTNMQIYWDHIFFTAGSVKAPVKMTDVVMTRATLGFRGYSSSYRKGGPYGPEWFDYDHTTGGQKWRDLTGNYTRYGDVLPLLLQGDDKYIIADGGDEISIDFDAQRLPPIPKGWKRDFLIYSEGWVKDGDLNTANGQTVLPLPFHKMTRYPYQNEAYPNDPGHKEYQQKYNTRKVTTDDFKNALRNPGKPILDKSSSK